MQYGTVLTVAFSLNTLCSCINVLLPLEYTKIRVYPSPPSGVMMCSGMNVRFPLDYTKIRVYPSPPSGVMVCSGMNVRFPLDYTKIRVYKGLSLSAFWRDGVQRYECALSS